jgi:TonB-dependent SusC/RagA subfamily outer membrane receptor
MPVEIGPEFSGYVKSVAWGRSVEDVEVTAISFTGGFIGSARTDKDGHFHLPVGEFPDSTLLMISVDPKRGLTHTELILDMETFPERTIPALISEIDIQRFDKYVDNAEQKNIDETGVRIYELPEINIVAQREPTPRRSQFYSIPSNTVTEEVLEKLGPIDIYSVLRRIAGVQLFLNPEPPPTYNIIIRGIKGLNLENTPQHTLVLINNSPVDASILDDISIYDISQIDILKGTSTAIFGSRGANGVIAIYGKTGSSKIESQVLNIKTLLPLGHQQPVEFYAPKYDTPQAINSTKSDLRTTIHWQPVVQTNSEGVASFEFYTADKETSYTVVIEGLADDGSIIRHEGKLWNE